MSRQPFYLVISLFCILIFVSIISYASDTLIVGENKLISFQSDSMAKTEPHLVIDPTDVNHFVVACISTYPSNKPSRGYISIYNSFDGGKTWMQKDFNGPDVLMQGDPWLCINKKGVVMLSFLMRDTADKWHLKVYSSQDKGKSWIEEASFKSGYDHETIVCNPITDEFVLVSVLFKLTKTKKLHAYLFTHRFTNEGKSKNDSKEHRIANTGFNTLTPVFTDSGLLIIPFIDYKDENDKVLSGKRSWIVKSADNGLTITSPFLITEDKFSGTFPSSAIDLFGGQFHNHIYFVKMSEHSPTNIGISLYKSEMKGEEWMGEIKAGYHSEPFTYMRNPSVAVNKNGVVGIYWYDRRGDSLQQTQHIYFTYSTDGGKSFSEPKRITSSPSVFDGKLMWADTRYRSGGEYSGLATLPDGSFVLVWADRRNGRYQLYYSKLRIIQSHF